MRIPAAHCLIFALGALAGCGWAEWPPPEQGGASATSSGAGAAPAQRAGTGTVTVGGRDTLYGIAQRHRVGVRALIDANGLRPPYRLTPGQRLKLPEERYYTVKRGDTLYGISQRHGAGVYQLARRNGIGAPYTIHVGQKLVLPQATARPGRKDAEDVVAARTDRPRSTAALSRGQPVPARKPSAPAKLDKPGARAGGFLWPAKGRLVSGFGPKAKGLHNDGINIGARRGTPVRASENGVVAYAGNELKGFGNLLLIRHSGGWVTAYAHNENLLVKRGQKVRRGQIVARVGSTGSVAMPQLHFELRRGKRAVDPRVHLVQGRV